MKYKLLRITNIIFLIILMNGCGFFSKNIQNKNDGMAKQLCDRWLNGRISDSQIIKEFNIYNIKKMDEVKIMCIKYESLIKD